MRDLLADLNDRQREAVTAPLGPVLVLAGAGSGKTRVLTYRIAYLLEQKIFAPPEILALTFTNKAAGEMRGRIEKLFTPSPNPSHQGRESTKKKIPPPFVGEGRWGVTMGTFHSVCARILRHEIAGLKRGYDRNFVIYDQDDSQRLLKQILLELGMAERFRPNVVAYYISAAKNRLLEPHQLALQNSFLEETVQTAYQEYQRRLQSQNAVDFDDLLGLTCELLAQVPTVLRKYQDRFRYVLVDEYQDTNHAQYVFLRLLVKKHKNLFVVGDDAQSIYGFRGANLQNILDFRKDYRKARVIMLEQNYRSTQNILDTAAQVLKLNTFQYEKRLWTKNEAGQKVRLYEAADETDEGGFVLSVILNPPLAEKGSRFFGLRPQNDNRVEELVYETEETPILNQFFKLHSRRRSSSLPIYGSMNRQATDLGETVILYRTHAQSRPLEELLLSSGVPYQIVGGIKFYERQEIKDVLAYLRLLLNPRDLVSLARVINLPARGIGEANFRYLVQGLQKFQFNFGRLGRNLAELKLQPKALEGARNFFRLYAGAGKIPKQENLLGVMKFFLARSGYQEAIRDGSPEGENRWENIEELFNVAARYKRLPWAAGLRAFLEEAALMTDLDDLEEESNKLTLMTLHSAKGLEFENVFLVGLEEGLLPHSRSLLSPQELAEEIRLAYVGMTRAKRNLYLSYALQRQTFGEWKRAVPSRIIKAIPKRLIEKIPPHPSLSLQGRGIEGEGDFTL